MCPLPLALALLALAACVRHIPEPGPGTVVPDTTVGRVTRACWVEFARGTFKHGDAVAHGALAEDVPSTQSGLLVVHAAGAWLIDAGAARETDLHRQAVHGLDRVFIDQAASGWELAASIPDALASGGMQVSALTGIIPTHAHFDHLGGAVDAPGVSVLLLPAEIEYARAAGFGVLPAEAKDVLPRAKAIDVSAGPFLSWPEHADLTGDGAVVVVPLPGHTPGSVGVRVRLPDGRSAFLVGDTVWVREGYEAREPKGLLATGFDAEPETNDVQIQRLWALHRSDPNLLILPAHDRRAWVSAFEQPGCVGPG